MTPGLFGSPVELPTEDFETILRKSDAAVEDLRRRTSILPWVDIQGHSECPFALDLYMDKYKAEENVFRVQARLHVHLNYLEAQIDRCRKNIAAIAARSRPLSNSDVRDRLTEAEDIETARLMTLIEKRNRIRQAIRQCETVLAESFPKQYPVAPGPQTEFRAPGLPPVKGIGGLPPGWK